MKKVMNNKNLNTFIVIVLGIIIGCTVSTSAFSGILLTLAFILEVICAINLIRLDHKKSR